MCDECDVLDLETEINKLNELPVVSSSRLDGVVENARVGVMDRRRVFCTLWCGHQHEAGDMRQTAVKCKIRSDYRALDMGCPTSSTLCET